LGRRQRERGRHEGEGGREEPVAQASWHPPRVYGRSGCENPVARRRRDDTDPDARNSRDG
jgi:hypothetical protein